MTDIFSLPREVMLEILTFLPYSDLISVERTCQHWCDLSKDNKIRGRLATGIQSIWDDRILKEAYFPSAAEVRCAAALATTGHLTSVKHMNLVNLELPSEDIPKLARIVSHSVNLETVTGNISPLLLSLNCTELSICDMELDQAATRSLVRGLQHGVKKVHLQDDARLHLETLLEYDGKGRCNYLVCYDSTREVYRDQLRAWAIRVDWGMGLDDGFEISMWRHFGH